VKRILVIDDEEATLDILKQVLEMEGYDVTTAGDGEEGLALFGSDPFDLVITDMVMPVKDGLDTILELKKKAPGLPVIAMSGGGRIPKERYLEVAKYLGNTKTLPKPFSRDEIVTMVKEHLASGEFSEGIEV